MHKDNSYIHNFLKLYQPSRWNQTRVFLNIIAIFFSFLILFPIFGLTLEGLNGFLQGSVRLNVEAFKQVKGTITLLFLSLSLGGFIGTINGWLLANCSFTGRKYLRIAQLIPLATPAYLLAATLIDLGSIHGIRIYGMYWGVLIMAFTTYPYLFLLSAESFTKGGRSQLEACRSLGIGPWQSFFRIALPIAKPAIGTGVALMAMEIINELGAVQLLNIPSISAGIVESWIEENDPSGAIALAMVALLIVMSLIAYERILRTQNKRWSDGVRGGDSPEWELKGTRSLLAQIICLIPPTFTLGVPILWTFINSEQLTQGLDIELFHLTIRTFELGIAAATVTSLIAIIISIAKRWQKSKWLKVLNFLSGIGYAIPGSVLALALLGFGNSFYKLPTLTLLIWGYCIRFLAISKDGIDAAFERISPNIDEAATGLGSKWPDLLKRIHLPLLRGPISVGILFVFVDTLKELPITFVLRPFDFDTLSVRIFQYAGDERLAESILPALIILLLGLLSSIALIPTLDNRKGNNISQ